MKTLKKTCWVLGLSFNKLRWRRDSLAIKLIKKLKQNNIKFVATDEFYKGKEVTPLKKLIKIKNYCFRCST